MLMELLVATNRLEGREEEAHPTTAAQAIFLQQLKMSLDSLIGS